MQQIADWLEKLGMSEYAQRFAENGIDISALPHLTIRTSRNRRSAGASEEITRGHRELAGAARATPEPAAANGAEDPRHRRAPPSHGDVLRPGRFDRALGPHGPRGLARGHFGLSEMRCRDRAPLRRVRREIHGRRRAGLLRLPAGARGRRRAGGAGRAGRRSARWRSSRRAHARRCKSASGSRPGSSWSAI